MEARAVEEHVREIAGRAATEYGVELVHVEIAAAGRGLAVRVFIDRPEEGVTHGDCANVSHHMGTVLDVEDFIPSAYTLEVSSPGLERGLYRREDYERFAGRLAKLKARVPVGGQRNFRGRIVGVEGDDVVFDDKTTGLVHVPVESIAKANLEIDVEAEFRLAAERERAAAQAGRSGTTE
ncbi:MAG: ribosome maturation factor RimP [Pyrinomonadaceae bacterium]